MTQLPVDLLGSGKKRMCGYADVATGKMRMLMQRRIRILPVVEIATVIANESVLQQTVHVLHYCIQYNKAA